MEPWVAENYWLTRLVFQRALAIIYLVAFLVAANQFRPLAGEDGLLSLHRYVESTAFKDRPSLFHLVPSDRIIAVTAWTGVVLSVLAILGGPYFLPEPYPVVASMLLWAAMWLLYLSFVNAGQLFYGFGWESMLLEVGFLAIFLGAGITEPPILVIWLVKWALFRNMFGAGLIKLRGGDCWRDLTCLEYHYETQPIPNPLSRFAHRLPRPFHRVEALGNHIVELAIPFLYFAPQPFAAVAGGATILFQLWLMLTGNFAWLNALTIVMAIPTVDDAVLSTLIGIDAPTTSPTPAPLLVLAGAVGAVLVLMSVRPAINMLSPGQVMNSSYDPLHLVNSYGAFGSITRRRYQLVIEGTREPDPDPDDWEAYEFKGQPVRTDERPPQWAPYHLRLDWQLWFAAMRPRPGLRQEWVLRLLEKLLDNDPEMLELLRTNPFPDVPPAKIRIRRYRYRFTSKEARAETGDWWRRELLGEYVPPVSAADLRTAGTPMMAGRRASNAR